MHGALRCYFFAGSPLRRHAVREGECAGGEVQTQARVRSRTLTHTDFPSTQAMEASSPTQSPALHIPTVTRSAASGSGEHVRQRARRRSGAGCGVR